MRLDYFLLFFGLVFSACSISSHLDTDPKYVKDDLSKYQRIDSVPGNLTASAENFLFTSSVQEKPETVQQNKIPENVNKVKNPVVKKIKTESYPDHATQMELMTNREEKALKEALQKEVDKLKEVRRSDNIIHTNSINLGQSNSGRLIGILAAVGGILTLGLGAGSLGSSKKLIVFLIGAVLFVSGMVFLFG